ncbi:hypothetical protein ACJMK2_037632 [Sinanodonta woodiana]|uniref:Uncharacterized protein n=1 Tax=Sinanodonta woodiana TaxID=1069815 RepID=A0ABD3WMF3_SINWO
MGSVLRKHRKVTQLTVKEYSEPSSEKEIVSPELRNKQTEVSSIECTNSSKDCKSGEELEHGGKYLKTKVSRDGERESRFINPSEFPYRKPKLASFKHRDHVGKTRVDNVKHTDNHFKDNFVQSQIGGITKLERRRSKKEAWAPGVYPTGKPLPHKTVVNLQRSTSDDQWETPDSYKSNRLSCPRLHQNRAAMIDRPPTPCPWVPIRRTEDYLTASSLHAYERIQDVKRGLVSSQELPEQ